MEMDDNDLSKDGDNSLSQSLFDDQTSSRTRKSSIVEFEEEIFEEFLALTGQKINDSQLPRGGTSNDLNDDEDADDQQIQGDSNQAKRFHEPDVCEQSHHIVVPSYSAWFDYNAINSIEKRGVSEFFNGKNRSKTPEM